MKISIWLERLARKIIPNKTYSMWVKVPADEWVFLVADYRVDTDTFVFRAYGADGTPIQRPQDADLSEFAEFKNLDETSVFYLLKRN